MSCKYLFPLGEHIPIATRLAPVPFAGVLIPVRVPPGCFAIEVVQFWRGERSRDSPFPLHWALFVRTSGRNGNYYHVLGNTDTFTVVAERNQVQRQTDLWRGNHTIGYIPPHQLGAFEAYLSCVPVIRHDPTWNSQQWVNDALRTLRSYHFFIDVEITMAKLQTQMVCLLEAWELGEI